ncbi:MAG: hypothetical protein LBL94_03490 [Prevotellaceae bacterium]|nr:hypothetical protein [Prevotellaceae bacterium]
MPDKQQIKLELFRRLASKHAFWSYNLCVLTPENITDEMLICKTLVHLDLEEIGRLLTLYGVQKVKEVWKKELCIQEPYYHNLNVMLAGIFFSEPHPTEYVRRVSREHLASIKQRADEMFNGLTFDDE